MDPPEAAVKGWGSVESVVAAIREEAAAEAEKTDIDAAKVAARLRDEDTCLPVMVPDGDLRIARAHRVAHDRLAEADWADRTAALNAREAWLTRVAAEGRRRLAAAAPDVRRADLSRLAYEAVERVRGDRIRLLMAPGDAALADETWIAEVNAATGKNVAVVVSADVDGGCIASSEDGRIRFDNSYTARERRFAPAWRAGIGSMMDATAAMGALVDG